MAMNPLGLLPEICLMAGAVIGLLAGSFLPRNRQWVTRLIAVAALLASAITALTAMSGAAAETAFEGTFAIDAPTGAARLIIAVSTLLVIALGAGELAGHPRESEIYVLLLLASLGAAIMAGANDLLVLVVGYLLATIPLYALIGLRRTPKAAEAALKTYLLGALLGIALMLGVTMLYGVSGATGYQALTQGLAEAPPTVIIVGIVGVVAGLMFKAGGVPGHFWVPDAAQGAGIAAAAFLTTVPKIGALVAAYRFLTAIPETIPWPLLVAVLAAASMSLGNLAAFAQTDARRLLGWSTVSQVGYMLLPVAVAGQADLALPSLLFYLAAYSVTNLAAFAVVASAPGRGSLKDYRGLVTTNPWLAGALVVSLLSLVGTPPTAVFVGKLTTFTAAWDDGFEWLVIVAALNTVASLFYYLRWIVPVFKHNEKRPGAGADTLPVTHRASTVTAVVASAVVLAVGIFAGPVLTLFSGPMAQ
ncbi:NADH-quinone oxidoreductase subunit N [Arthrobacter sp. H14]|uniref:NADH-quinone oxidoreductase subunit N n=1 Tax=Arthrobacter sp. H14 TaxID=1312959 RepID=UPI001C1E5262|nr:NADH-quinone oxidoreductase subunit N [Arthrobacter sp. H14]